MNQSVLFFDGQLKHLEAIQAYLHQEDIQPLFATTSQEAVVKIQQHRPSLIFINCKDPLLNGTNLHEVLALKQAASEIPAIFIADHEAAPIQNLEAYADVIMADDDPARFMKTLTRIVQKYLLVSQPEHHIHILIAEDDLIIRKTVERLLHKNGYTNLRFAVDGRQAWEMINQSAPELIILDYMMPHATGFEVLQRIRADYRFDHIPVIFLTALSDKERLIEALDAGATDYITKPFDQSELLARVQTHARNFFLQQQILKINEHLGQVNKELSVKNLQIEGDLRSARKIQEALLPKEHLVRDDVSIHFFYQPSHSVGGDFLNYVLLDDSHIAFYIADVSGHGVTSAMITVFVREQIANILRKKQTSEMSAATILEELNKNYNEEIYFLDNGVYLTIFFGILHIPTRQLNYASAGHHAFPIVCSANGTVHTIDKTEIAIGFVDDYTYSDQQLTLQKNDRLVLHTDGVMEMRNSGDEFFGLERISKLVAEHPGTDPCKLLELIVKAGNEFSHEKEQSDDIALMVLDIL